MVLVRLPFVSMVGTQFPYTTVYIAVLISARFWGVGPGVFASVLGAIGDAYFFIEPRRQFMVHGTHNWVGLGFYFIVSFVSIWMIELQRRARAEAEENERLAEQRLQELRIQIQQRERSERHSAQLQAIVESSADAIISRDLRGVIQSWNQGAEQIFGYTAEEAIGQQITMLLPPGHSQSESELSDRASSEGRVKHFETMRACKGGKLIHVSLTISPIWDNAGNVVGASHIARDITGRKEFEEQLRQTQKLESLGVLAGGLAHDFNNLLTGIMGNASLALDDKNVGGTGRERIEEIVQASERAALLIRQILAYAGKGRFVIEQMNLSRQISEIIPLIRTSVSRNVVLELRLEEKLPPIEADPAQMQQLIMNLVINGAEAIGSRPGTVIIQTRHRKHGAEDQVVLEVQDDGCGMDEQTKARIFDPFYTTKFTGRGLGLAAVMGIIRAHQGTIAVDTAPRSGARFTVTLPAATPREETAAAKPEERLAGEGTILVVDDEELIRNMARFTLEKFGYAVVVASDGVEAVEEFSAGPNGFVAVLLDLTMPVMSGEETLQRIQAIRPAVPVVLTSGYSEADALERFNQQGLAGFLQKPYTATALARKIEQAVRQRRDTTSA